jgi:hypothetical protein
MLREQIALHLAQACQQSTHDVGGAEGVRKSRVLGAGEREGSDAELTNAPQSLHLGRLEEPLDDAIFGGVESDESVDRVAENHVGASNQDVGSARGAVSPPLPSLVHLAPGWESDVVKNEASGVATLPSRKYTRARTNGARGMRAVRNISEPRLPVARSACHSA